jgi:hypothetical protein
MMVNPITIMATQKAGTVGEAVAEDEEMVATIEDRLEKVKETVGTTIFSKMSEAQ